MRPLPTTWTKRGISYEIIKRSGNVLMVEVSMSGVCGWEVGTLHRDPDRDIHGSICPAHERWLGDEEFGGRGWYFMVSQEAEAFRCFHELCSKKDSTIGQDAPPLPVGTA